MNYSRLGEQTGEEETVISALLGEIIQFCLQIIVVSMKAI